MCRLWGTLKAFGTQALIGNYKYSHTNSFLYTERDAFSTDVLVMIAYYSHSLSSPLPPPPHPHPSPSPPSPSPSSQGIKKQIEGLACTIPCYMIELLNISTLITRTSSLLLRITNKHFLSTVVGTLLLFRMTICLYCTLHVPSPLWLTSNNNHKYMS